MNYNKLFIFSILFIFIISLILFITILLTNKNHREKQLKVGYISYVK